MTNPDGTAAFAADAEAHRDLSREELEAKLRNYESRVGDGEPEPEIFDERGREVVAETDNVPEVDNAETVTVADTDFRFHPPKSAALVAFGMGASVKKNPQVQLATMQRFLSFSLLEEDYDRMMDRMMDPADGFDEGDMSDIVGAIADKVRQSPEAKAPKNGPRNR